MAEDGGCERDVVTQNECEYKAWGAELKSALSNRGLWIKAKKSLYGVIVPTALYGAEAWGLKSAA